jgi:hypothetical protein
MKGMRGLVVLTVAALLFALVPGSATAHPGWTTDATYYNNAASPGADPFVLFDEASGYYYAYSTEGADPGYNFAIYRSPDLATWEHLPGGALRAGQDGDWAHDWFWAPEVYHNPKTGLYFLFYAGRMNQHVAEHFRYPDFEEASKVGVAVSRSPAGPFHDIVEGPLDYFPYDPAYHDVNLIMDETQKKPPATLEEGQTAPLGTYLPFIDPNVFFDADGRVYLYYSRNAYRNWVWDTDLGKYIEESNIYAVELTGDWWRDPTGATMPAIAPAYRNTNLAPDDPPDTRKDGFVPILNYGSDKQDWENAHVDDYANSNGEKKDRRWAEGSTTIRTIDRHGKPTYHLTYSANNFENEFYGVGTATSSTPLGPWHKARTNPILSQDPAQGMYSTGHGSITKSPDNTQNFYIHHARPTTTSPRALYTSTLDIDPEITIQASTKDEPLPPGVGPLTLQTDDRLLRTRPGQPVSTTAHTYSAPGAEFDLTNPLNRLRAQLKPASAGTVTITGNQLTVTVTRPAVLTITYQRQQANGTYQDAHNTRPGTRIPIQTKIQVTTN